MTEKRALLVIDMLNDFVKEKGTLVVPGANEKLPQFKKRVDEAREKGEIVIYVCDNHRPDDPEFEKWPPHCVEGTWGAQVVDELNPQENDFKVRKRRYSAFFGTDLDLLLKELGVETLVLTGLVTNICVMCTAIDAAMRGYKLEVVKDCVVALDEEMNKFALKEMEEVLGAKIV
jgi:nicotinamidase-related amidase